MEVHPFSPSLMSWIVWDQSSGQGQERILVPVALDSDIGLLGRVLNPFVAAVARQSAPTKAGPYRAKEDEMASDR